jgi:hypothetical protein
MCPMADDDDDDDDDNDDDEMLCDVRHVKKPFRIQYILPTEILFMYDA